MAEIIYGIHAVRHALMQENNQIVEILSILTTNNQRILTLLSTAQEKKILTKTVTKAQLTAYCESHDHQGIAAKVSFPDIAIDEDDLLAMVENKQVGLLLVLDAIQDPHNLGAILRTADAAGVSAVVVPQDNSVKLTPAVRKVACGAAETMPLVVVKNLARFLKALQSLGVWVVGTAEREAKTIYEIDLTGAIALVLGAEGQGLRQLTAKHCDYLVSIPMYGQVESLNVSVSAGICLYEAVRQRLGRR